MSTKCLLIYFEQCFRSTLRRWEETNLVVRYMERLRRAFVKYTSILDWQCRRTPQLFTAQHQVKSIFTIKQIKTAMFWTSARCSLPNFFVCIGSLQNEPKNSFWPRDGNLSIHVYLKSINVILKAPCFDFNPIQWCFNTNCFL